MPATLPPPAARARLLWDQGHLWSLMTWEACVQAGLPITPISAAQVARGGLERAGLLVVPGGWPALKHQALGPQGRQAIREFVDQGGRYLGLCGGAGLALEVEQGLGLAPLSRAGGGQRLPSLNGPLWVLATPPGREHPLWRRLDSPARFHVWWPGQFDLPETEEVKVLAVYHRPASGLCSADLVVDQMAPGQWSQWEAQYGIFLDPARIDGQPAVVEVRQGRGAALLSYLHFDTPGDPAGARALANLWSAWLGISPGSPPALETPRPGPWSQALGELWNQGRLLGLWRNRSPVMPLWRRGARGLEFWSLWRLIQAAEDLAARQGAGLSPELDQALEPVREKGPQVLAAMADQVEGHNPSPAALKALGDWFPAPRRLDGELARALALAENELFSLTSWAGED